MSRPARTRAVLRLPALRQRAQETVGEFAYRRLRLAIMTGRFPPGVAVTIRGLATLLGTSAMPVREAMRRLAAERALDLMDNRRARIPEMPDARFLSLMETRILLEKEAASRAYPHLAATGIAALYRLDQAVTEAFARNDQERSIETNFAFHRCLYAHAPDDVLSPLIESIWLQIGPFMRAAMREAQVHYRIDRHQEALAALDRRDKAALLIAIEADIRDALGHISLAEQRAA